MAEASEASAALEVGDACKKVSMIVFRRQSCKGASTSKRPRAGDIWGARKESLREGRLHQGAYRGALTVPGLSRTHLIAEGEKASEH